MMKEPRTRTISGHGGKKGMVKSHRGSESQTLNSAICRCQLPFTAHCSPFAVHLSPLTSPLSPLTSHLSPLTSRLSPLTSHLSPLTSHRRRNADTSLPVLYV